MQVQIIALGSIDVHFSDAKEVILNAAAAALLPSCARYVYPMHGSKAANLCFSCTTFTCANIPRHGIPLQDVFGHAAMQSSTFSMRSHA